MNLTEKLAKLGTLRTEVADLEADIGHTRRAELAALPGKYGFPNARAFIKALKKATGGLSGLKSSGRRTRTAITDSIRAKVKKLATGGKTGAQIAAATGISLPSVQKIKKEFGLVKARK